METPATAAAQLPSGLSIVQLVIGIRKDVVQLIVNTILLCK